MLTKTDKLKKVIDDIDKKFISEVIDDSVKYTDKDKISRYEDKEDGSYYDLYYIKDKDITILDIYDGYYSYTFTYKTKINPDNMAFYHFSKISEI